MKMKLCKLFIVFLVISGPVLSSSSSQENSTKCLKLSSSEAFSDALKRNAKPEKDGSQFYFEFGDRVWHLSAPTYKLLKDKTYKFDSLKFKYTGKHVVQNDDQRQLNCLYTITYQTKMLTGYKKSKKITLVTFLD